MQPKAKILDPPNEISITSIKKFVNEIYSSSIWNELSLPVHSASICFLWWIRDLGIFKAYRLNTILTSSTFQPLRLMMTYPWASVSNNDLVKCKIYSSFETILTEAVLMPSRAIEQYSAIYSVTRVI